MLTVISRDAEFVATCYVPRRSSNISLAVKPFPPLGNKASTSFQVTLEISMEESLFISKVWFLENEMPLRVKVERETIPVFMAPVN
jgi:hypothetical protein